jgi:hypothetical protein
MSSSSGSPDQWAIPKRVDVATSYMDESKKLSSRFVTTSFSFAWEVWEATRRYKLNTKQAIEIAVIDARSSSYGVRACTNLKGFRPKSEDSPTSWCIGTNPDIQTASECIWTKAQCTVDYSYQ